MEIKLKTKKWKDALIVIIPEKIAKKQKIRQNQEVTILIKNRRPVTKGKDIQGTMKFSKPTEQLMREMDTDF